MNTKFLTNIAFTSFLFLIHVNLAAQKSNIEKEKWHWGAPLKQDTTAGYAQVVKVDNVLYISGPSLKKSVLS